MRERPVKSAGIPGKILLAALRGGAGAWAGGASINKSRLIPQLPRLKQFNRREVFALSDELQGHLKTVHNSRLIGEMSFDSLLISTDLDWVEETALRACSNLFPSLLPQNPICPGQV